MTRLEKTIDKLKAGSVVTIAGLGDSLTQGWMVKAGFFDRFCDSLQDLYHDATIKRLNFGVPGSTAGQGLSRVDALLQANPDVVVVQFALNDCFMGIPVSEYKRDIENLVNDLMSKAELVVLVTSCPVPDPQMQEMSALFYQAIKEVGVDLSVPVADLENFWNQREKTKPSLQPLYQSDQVHPTDAGHLIMAEGLLDIFKKASQA